MFARDLVQIMLINIYDRCDRIFQLTGLAPPFFIEIFVEINLQARYLKSSIFAVDWLTKEISMAVQESSNHVTWSIQPERVMMQVCLFTNFNGCKKGNLW